MKKGISSVRLTAPATRHELATKKAPADRRTAGHSCARSSCPGVPPARRKTQPAAVDETASSRALKKMRLRGHRVPRRRSDAAIPATAAVIAAAGIPRTSSVAKTNVKAIDTFPMTGRGIRDGEEG